MKKIITTFLIILFALNPILANAKICSNKTGKNEYIKVKNNAGSLSFERCMKNGEDEMCVSIAFGQSFTVNDIKNEKNKALWKTAGTSVLDVALVVAGVCLGAKLGLSALFSIGNGDMVGAILIGFLAGPLAWAGGAGIGGAAALSLPYFIDAINPLNHLAESRALGKLLHARALDEKECLWVDTPIIELTNNIEEALSSVPGAAVATNMEKQLKTRINELAVQDNSQNAQVF